MSIQNLENEYEVQAAFIKGFSNLYTCNVVSHDSEYAVSSFNG